MLREIAARSEGVPLEDGSGNQAAGGSMSRAVVEAEARRPRTLLRHTACLPPVMSGQPARRPDEKYLEFE